MLAEDKFDTIYFAEEANWPPYTPNAYGIAEEGLSLELMEAIFSQLNLEVEVELVPQRRMLQYMRLGTKDAVTVITKSPERLRYLEYTDPIISTDRGLIYYLSDRKEPFEWRRYRDLQGLRIGAVSGHNYGVEFNQAVEEFDLDMVEVGRVVQNFDMLLAGRIDIFLAAESTANEFLSNTKYNGKITSAKKPTREISFHIAFSKKSRAKVLIPRVNGVIQKMRADGSLQAIVDKY
ncbi:ABC transporter substrate-binding protein [Pelagibius sp. Alg239-R121]|uniref:substrate-binding periplasmic protein n=1 Tax=Pelagibius sp. Alg239-R121 TaxID=2993448 RepID=UPI0024A6EF36|nr:transporter substrate-binding domain-containing protein [Pelagibius sp. Alg239-R121]